MFLMARKKEIV